MTSLIHLRSGKIAPVAAAPRNMYDHCPAAGSRRGRSAAPRHALQRYRPAEGLANMRGMPV